MLKNTKAHLIIFCSPFFQFSKTSFGRDQFSIKYLRKCWRMRWTERPALTQSQNKLTTMWVFTQHFLIGLVNSPIWTRVKCYQESYLTRQSALGMSDPIKDQLIVDPFEYGQHTRNMVNIPEIWSTYQIYGRHSTYCNWRKKVKISDFKKIYKKAFWVWKRRKRKRKRRRKQKKATVWSVPIGSDKNMLKIPSFQPPITTENLASHKAACPKLPPDECQDDQPDPPDPPKPPEEPVCGDLVVEEPVEECDCGFDYLQCQVFIWKGLILFSILLRYISLPGPGVHSQFESLKLMSILEHCMIVSNVRLSAWKWLAF